VNLIVVKALLETRSSLTPLQALPRRAAAAEDRLERLDAHVDDLDLRVHDSLEGLANHQNTIEELASELPSLTGRIAHMEESEGGNQERAAAQARSIDDLQRALHDLTVAHEATRAGLVNTRSLADRLGVRLRAGLVPESRIRAVASTNVEAPTLSIAIPSFNRPRALAELLGSISEEVSACAPGLIEVCITDDASTDPDTLEVALEFAERHRYAALHVNASNIGLERNLMAACQPCRGDYLLLVGNDDVVAPGALATILDDIGATEAPVLLYSKRRIDIDGSPRADVEGSIPIELSPGETHLFSSVIDAARMQGLLSTLGFIGPLIRSRKQYLAVDPSPYLDLTMYAQVFVTVEAFSGQEVFYRNLPTILHRTPTPAQKHGEALTLAEEDFMRGGRTRLSRYFGTTLAAALQRLIDSGAVELDTVASMPERLMTELPLVEWISRNRRLLPETDDRLSPDVVRDAERFFESLPAGATSQ
jgi:hypothetical protein